MQKNQIPQFFDFVDLIGDFIGFNLGLIGSLHAYFVLPLSELAGKMADTFSPASSGIRLSFSLIFNNAILPKLSVSSGYSREYSSTRY